MFRGRHKFNARKTVVGEDTFDSVAEADRYQVLKLLQRAGGIFSLCRQVPFELQPAFVYEGRHVRAIVYVADFTYLELPDREIVEDVKGFATEGWKLKAKLFKFKYPHKHLRIVENGRADDEVLQAVRKVAVLQRGQRMSRVRRRIWP